MQLCETCAASKDESSAQAIGAFDLLCLIVLIATVSVAKAGRAIHLR